ncbi:MAG: two-component system alkaline phosphatase synthesis response regulator PhoP [Bacteroidia bacterium]|jgi:two-component system alkaline phosphatase synthesis response regulator PhoP
MSSKILIVDDEVDIVEFICYNLEKEGYTVQSAHSGAEAVQKAKSFQPDLIIIDVMMPQMDGIEACRKIRENEDLNRSFIMFLTARSEEYSEIAGFEAGGDDYVTKPIKPRALISRVHAIMKRQNAQTEPDTGVVLTHGDLVVNPNEYIVVLGEQRLNLPRKEFDLLYLLASKPAKVFTREKILRKVWGTDVFVVDRTIDVHIRKIREKIGDSKIETVKGVGYKFVG